MQSGLFAALGCKVKVSVQLQRYVIVSFRITPIYLQVVCFPLEGLENRSNTRNGRNEFKSFRRDLIRTSCSTSINKSFHVSRCHIYHSPENTHQNVIGRFLTLLLTIWFDLSQNICLNNFYEIYTYYNVTHLIDRQIKTRKYFEIVVCV